MVKEDESDEIAGVHLHWIIDLCNLRKFPLDNLNRRLGLDLTSMLGNNQTLTWQAFADLFASLCMFFDDQDFRKSPVRHRQGAIGSGAAHRPSFSFFAAFSSGTQARRSLKDRYFL